MTNFLFIGDTSPHSTSRFYAEGLNALGFKVMSLSPHFFESEDLFERLLFRITRTPSKKNTQVWNEAFTKLLNRHSFDFAFVFAENFLPLESLALLRSKGTQLIYHSHDNNFSRGILKPQDFFSRLKQYDFIFTTKSQNVQKYLDLGAKHAKFIPSAFAPETHHPIPKSKSRFHQTFPVSFIGTYDHSRNPLLKAVGWESLHVWGNGWKRSPQFFSHRKHIHPAIYNEEFADAISQSQVSLGFLRKEAGDLHTQRTFEIPACGTLQIAPRVEEILGFFEEDREIVCFSSPEELRDKVRYYLSHEQERVRIARAGYERVTRDHHTYSDRIRTILTTIQIG